MLQMFLKIEMINMDKMNLELCSVTRRDITVVLDLVNLRSQAKGLSGSPGVGSKLCTEAFFLPRPVPLRLPGVPGVSELLRPCTH